MSFAMHKAKRHNPAQDHADILKLVQELWDVFHVEADCEKVTSDEGDVSFCVTVGGTEYVVLPHDEQPGAYNTFRAELDGSITPRLPCVSASMCLTYKHA